MPFDQAAFQDTLEEYLNNNVTLRIIDYYGDVNPVGGQHQGVNIDVGETNSFDLEIKNDGSLGMVNIAVNITARRGRISGTYSGFAGVAGSQWTTAWLTTWQTRKFNVGPNETLTLKHEISGGHLFGYVADEPTGGTDNNRDVETLLTARFAYWQPDLNNLIMKPANGPEDTYENFIQRS